MTTDMQQHKRILEHGTRIAAGNDAIWVATSGIGMGYITVAVESVDGGVTLNRQEAEQFIAAIRAKMEGA